jgi:hypothetical protein
MAAQRLNNENGKKQKNRKIEKNRKLFFRFATTIKCDGSPSTFLKRRKKQKKTRVQF